MMHAEIDTLLVVAIINKFVDLNVNCVLYTFKALPSFKFPLIFAIPLCSFYHFDTHFIAGYNPSIFNSKLKYFYNGRRKPMQDHVATIDA